MNFSERQSTSILPRRPLSAAVRHRIIGGSVVIALAVAGVIGVLVAITLKRKPVFGAWPIVLGLVGIAAGAVWAWWYGWRRFYFALYGLESTAIVVSVQGAARDRSRSVVIEYEVQGRVMSSRKADPLVSLSEGSRFAILVDPRDLDRSMRRDEILIDRRTAAENDPG